jgi:aldehyde:ferredoxin oxidoreductase
LGKLPAEALDYLIAIKNLPQSDALDLRYIKSFALGAAISSRGADHLRSRPTVDILNLPREVSEKMFGTSVVTDPTAYETKEIMVEFSETIFAVSDCLGICRFVCQGWNSPNLLNYNHFSELIKPAVGFEISTEELREIGRRVIDLERLINQREGLTKLDDTLPRRFFDEPMQKGTTTAGHYIDRQKFADLLIRYYRLRGWDDEGRLSGERTTEIQKITSIAEPPQASSS